MSKFDHCAQGPFHHTSHSVEIFLLAVCGLLVILLFSRYICCKSLAARGDISPATLHSVYNPPLAWTRAWITFCILTIINYSTGVVNEFVYESRHIVFNPNTKAEFLIYSFVILFIAFIFYWIIWSYNTLLFSRKFNIITLFFGIIDGITQGWTLSSIYWLFCGLVINNNIFNSNNNSNSNTGYIVEFTCIWLLCFIFFAVYRVIIDELWFSVYITPLHDTPKSMKLKVFLVHIPFSIICITYLIIYQNIFWFTLSQAIAICGANVGLRLPPFWKSINYTKASPVYKNKFGCFCLDSENIDESVRNYRNYRNYGSKCLNNSKNAYDGTNTNIIDTSSEANVFDEFDTSVNDTTSSNNPDNRTRSRTRTKRNTSVENVGYHIVPASSSNDVYNNNNNTNNNNNNINNNINNNNGGNFNSNTNTYNYNYDYKNSNNFDSYNFTPNISIPVANNGYSYTGNSAASYMNNNNNNNNIKTSNNYLNNILYKHSNISDTGTYSRNQADSVAAQLNGERGSTYKYNPIGGDNNYNEQSDNYNSDIVSVDSNHGTRKKPFLF